MKEESLKQKINDILSSEYCGNDDCVAIDQLLTLIHKRMEMLEQTHNKLVDEDGKLVKLEEISSPRVHFQVDYEMIWELLKEELKP